MTSIQVLLPGEVDSGEVPAQLVLADDTSIQQTTEKGGTTPRAITSMETHSVDVDLSPIDSDEPKAGGADTHGERADDTNSKQQLSENSTEKSNGIAGDMHRTNVAGTKTRTSSEIVKDSYKNGQSDVVDISNDDSARKRLTSEDASSKRGELWKDVGKLFGCFLCGIVFGIAAEKGRVFETATIRGQFIYQRWIMMKMFLSAAGTSCLCIALLSVIPATRRKFDISRSGFIGCLSSKGIIAVTIGGAILGAGMVIAGSCPGMVLVQIGAWLSNGGGAMTFFGCLVGAFVYGIFEPGLTRALAPSKPYDKLLADSYVEKWKVPFAVMALIAGIMMGLVVMTIELLVPWKTDLAEGQTPNPKDSWFFLMLAWPPYVAGILIGLLQIPLVLIMSDTIGGSSSYCTLCSQFLVTKKLRSWIPYLAKYRTGVDNWWQVFYVGGAIGGASISAAASSSLGSTPGVSLVSSFFGGFMIIVGARLAGGCTSGHGLSGMGVLSVLSFVTVAAMFAGGTAIGFIFWAVSNSSSLDYYTF